MDAKAQVSDWMERVNIALPLIIQAWFESYEFARQVVTDTIHVSSGTNHSQFEPTAADAHKLPCPVRFSDYGYAVAPTFKGDPAEYKAVSKYGIGPDGVCTLASTSLDKTLRLLQSLRININEPVVEQLSKLQEALRNRSQLLTPAQKLLIETVIGEWMLYQNLLVKYSADYFREREYNDALVYHKAFGDLRWEDLTSAKNHWWMRVPKVLFQTHGFVLNHLGITPNSHVNNHAHQVILSRFRTSQVQRFQEYGVDAPSQQILSALFPVLAREAGWAARTYLFHQLWNDALRLASIVHRAARVAAHTSGYVRRQWSETVLDAEPRLGFSRSEILLRIRTRLRNLATTGLAGAAAVEDGLWQTRPRPSLETLALPAAQPRTARVDRDRIGQLEASHEMALLHLLEMLKDAYLRPNMLLWSGIVETTLERLKFYAASLSDTLRVALEDWLQFVHASSQAIPANRLAQYRRQDADRKWTETLRVRMETRLSLWKQRLAVWQDDAACELLEAVAVANNLATTAVWVPAGIADHKQSMPIDELEQRLDVLMKQLDKRMQDDLDGEYAYIERTWLTHTSLQEGMFWQHLEKWSDICQSGLGCTHTVREQATPAISGVPTLTRKHWITGEECGHVVTIVTMGVENAAEGPSSGLDSVTDMDTETDADTTGTDTDTDTNANANETKVRARRARRAEDDGRRLTKCLIRFSHTLKTTISCKDFLDHTVRTFLGTHAEGKSLQTIKLPDRMVAVMALKRFATQFMCHVRQVLLRFSQDEWQLPTYAETVVNDVMALGSNNITLEQILTFVANVSLMMGWFSVFV